MSNNLTTRYQYLSNTNSAYIEELYERYLADPTQIEEKWRYFFDGFHLQTTIHAQENKLVQMKNPAPPSPALPNTQQDEKIVASPPTKATQPPLPQNLSATIDEKEIAVTKLIHAYRARGYISAKLNPLENNLVVPKTMQAQLDLPYFKLGADDLPHTFAAGNELKIGPAPLNEILKCLKATYATTMGVEFAHCKDANIRHWIYSKLEPSYGDPNYMPAEKLNIFKFLTRAVIFENFLQKKYIGQKRFGLEGGESLIPALACLINRGVDLGVEEFVFGMAHRGRLNVLVNILQKSYAQLFTEFEGGTLPDNIKGDGDVKYHLGQSADIEIAGRKIHLSLAFNPSHLEAVDPIVAGMVHAKADKYYREDNSKIIPILIHGDAAVAGQGVIYELANMSKLRGYDNGGTLHIVIDNQIGFTATRKETRSSLYATDIAYITDSPVFHVNGDDPLKTSYAFALAIEIRQRFKIDVWINMICYRRYGHNESDDPKFTNPLLYAKIKNHPNVLEIFKKQLFADKILTEKQAVDTQQLFEKELNEKLNEAREVKSHIHIDSLKRYWQDIRVATTKDMETSIVTKVSRATLDKIAAATTALPTDFNVYPKIARLFKQRHELYFKKEQVDWAFAEVLAFGTLLDNSRSVRLAGQDSVRGTFSHRHAVLKDMVSEKEYVPLSACRRGSAKFLPLNTQLSEYSVLGFEYGYSLARPHALVIWEAQFGDFVNCAQVIIDQFITSGESKWQRYSGIILLLPHGYEGMGPEHSSARLERFLQLCAVHNIYVTNVTTPANLFHLLRRPILASFRKPTIVMAPKSLIRHPQVISPLHHFTQSSFQEIIDDSTIAVKATKRILLCSGKIYFELLAERTAHKRNDTALIRLEQLYPLIEKQLLALKKKYAHVKEWLWVQEEPKNMGAWAHLLLHAPYLNLTCVSRNFSSSTASGMVQIHKRNQARVVQTAFAPSKTVAMTEKSSPVPPPVKKAVKMKKKQK